mmetsp:Transcript_52599/g.125622  ORF Transcript_52599/g.125622 Transcript_52599/m.125622 type:complete len:257 (-) Transcript_52599:45-815(-)
MAMMMQAAPLAFVPAQMERPQLRLRQTAAPAADLAASASGSPSGSLAVTVAASVAAFAAAVTLRTRSTRKSTKVVRNAHGEDLSVAHDSFVVLGLAHCFEQGEKGNQLNDVYVLEPVSASTVEVINNGAETSYESFLGTNVQTVLSEDVDSLPTDLLCGHELSQVRFAENLEFRTGCAARTWKRDHARDVVMKLVPEGEVQTDFNTNTRNKRILNFVNEVKDSDNIKQDMSIDVYGRSDEDAEEDGETDIEALYNA